MSLLTIGIPSYRRQSALASVLNSAIDQGICDSQEIETLIIDDNSRDGTYESIRGLDGVGNIRVLENSIRLGFCRQFGRLIDECRSEYIMFSCDDDFLRCGGIQDLLSFLKEAENPPALISTLFYNKGAVYRSQEDNFRPIDLAEYRVCCNHLPGVVFNSALAKAIWAKMGGLIMHPSNAYPQCCLSAVMLILGYPGIYAPIETVRTGYALETGITGYASVQGRWEQYKFFQVFFKHLEKILSKRPEASLATALVNDHESSLFTTLADGISNERPDLVSHFLTGAKRFVEKTSS